MKTVFIAGIPAISKDSRISIEAEALENAKDVLGEEVLMPNPPCYVYMVEEGYKQRDLAEADIIKKAKALIKKEIKARTDALKKGIIDNTPDNNTDLTKQQNIVELFETREKRRTPVLACLGENIKRMSECDAVMFLDGFESDEVWGGSILYSAARMFKKRVLIQSVQEIDLS